MGCCGRSKRHASTYTTEIKNKFRQQHNQKVIKSVSPNNKFSVTSTTKSIPKCKYRQVQHSQRLVGGIKKSVFLCKRFNMLISEEHCLLCNVSDKS